MAFMSLQKQATLLFTVALAVAASSYDDDAMSDNFDAPAVGPSLAQGAVKFNLAGPAHTSEVSESDPMTHFGSLDDIFDEPVQGFDETPETVQQAGSTTSFLRSMLASLIPKSASAFASLDDIFDDKAETVQEAEAEVAEFSLPKLLSNPSFYFTIAILICGGLVLTSSTDTVVSEQQPQQQQPQQPQQQQQQQLLLPLPQEDAPSTATPDATTVAEGAENVAKADAPRKTNPSRLVPSMAPLDLAAAASKAAAPAVEPNTLLAAADACKAGEAGSYANFCKLLAAQSSVQ